MRVWAESWVARADHPGPALIQMLASSQQTQRADICNKGPVCLATCHVCGDGASRHQLVFTAQHSLLRRDLSSGLRRVAKKAIVAISSSPDHCPVMSRWGLWSWILRKSWPSVYNESRDDEAFCHPDVRRDSRQRRVSSGGGGWELGPLVHSPQTVGHPLITHLTVWGRHQSAWHLSSSINLSGWVEKYFKIPTLLQISSYLHQFTHLHLEMWPKNEFSEKIRNANLLPH